MPLINPKSEDQIRQERKVWIAVVAVVLVAGAGAGAFFLRSPGDTKLAAAGPALSALPQAHLPPASLPGASDPSPLVDRLPAAAPQELTFSDMLDILGAESQKPDVAPVAKQFKQQFMANPRTRETLEEFRKARARGDRPSAKLFMSVLRTMPEFKAMASQFAFQPGGTQAMLALAQHPTLKKFLLEQKAMLKAGQASMAARDRRAAMLAGGTRFGGNPSYAAGRAGLAAHGANPAAGGHAGDKGATAFSATGAGGGLQSGADGARISGAGARASGSAGADANASGREAEGGLRFGGTPPRDVNGTTCTRLDQPGCSPRDVGADKLGDLDQALKEWIDQYGLRSIWDTIQNHGLWGSCFAQNKLSACDQACKNPPNRIKTLGVLPCRFPSYFPDHPYFSACLEWKGATALKTCLELCHDKQPICKSPQEIVDSFCRLPKDYKLNESTCKRIKAPDAFAVYCGSRDKCTTNKKECEEGGLTVGGARATCPVGGGELPKEEVDPYEKWCKGKPRSAKDGQCLFMDQNKGWKESSCAGMTEDECAREWVKAHDREVDNPAIKSFLAAPEPVRELCLRQRGYNWELAAQLYVSDQACGTSGGRSSTTATDAAPTFGSAPDVGATEGRVKDTPGCREQPERPGCTEPVPQETQTQTEFCQDGNCAR
ncbi:MAG: hypothetical protein HY553_05145 [Elusimicrobia bacterium]|nr:hypothetical protein [Elusimicrobiota bacterium]